MKIIKTVNGEIRFEEKSFSSPKPLNLIIAKNNLLEVKKILDARNVQFGLMYGTLLGAIRENNFITHDEDIDLFVLEENKSDLFNSLHDLIFQGFLVCRCDEVLLSIIKDDVYIDFYFFKKKFFYFRECASGLIYKRKYLELTNDYMFLGAKFKVPSNAKSFLKVLYGKNWLIPIKNDPSSGYSPYFRFRESIKKYLPKLFKLNRFLRNK